MSTRWSFAADVGAYDTVMPRTLPVGVGVMVLGVPVGDGVSVGELVGEDVSVGELVGDAVDVSVMVIVGLGVPELLEQPARASPIAASEAATARRRTEVMRGSCGGRRVRRYGAAGP
jgi:hypothetical protein